MAETTATTQDMDVSEEEARQNLDDLTVLGKVDTVDLSAEEQTTSEMHQALEDMVAMGAVQMGSRSDVEATLAATGAGRVEAFLNQSDGVEDGLVGRDRADLGAIDERGFASRGPDGLTDESLAMVGDGDFAPENGGITPRDAASVADIVPGEAVAAEPPVTADDAPPVGIPEGIQTSAAVEEEGETEVVDPVTVVGDGDAGPVDEGEGETGVEVPPPQVDGATVTAADVSGAEDTAIALDIDVTQVDAGERLAIYIDGVPEGASLSAGTDLGNGTWALSPEDLDGLTITPSADSGEDFSLTVRSVTTEPATGATSTSTQVLTVDLQAVSDGADLNVTPAAGSEDTAIGLDFSFGLRDTDGSEVLSGNIVLTGVPAGAIFNIGQAGADGTTWEIPQEALHVTATNDQGDPIAWSIPGLTVTPPDDSDADFTLGVQVTTLDGTDTETSSTALQVIVDPVADTPVLVLNDASGTEDQAISLDLSAALTDT
ncbi:MAG: hypothetical protein HQL82_16205, partial [Magnetococcales bacterium]|nr:hypothetical protein [Magnetococcales bacterium]